MNRNLRRVLMMGLGMGMGCTSGGGTALPGMVMQTVGAQGADIEVTSAGAPQIAGTRLLIPPGALSKDTLIAVSVGGELSQSASHENSVGPSVRFQPDGLQFAKPATLTLPYSAQKQVAGTLLAIDFSGTAGRGQLSGDSLTVDKIAGTVSVAISHFTDYEVVGEPGTTVQCASSSDCVSGQVCVSNQCLTQGTDGGVTDGGAHDGSTDSGILDGGVVDANPHDGATDSGIVDGGAGHGG